MIQLWWIIYLKSINTKLWCCISIDSYVLPKYRKLSLQETSYVHQAINATKCMEIKYQKIQRCCTMAFGKQIRSEIPRILNDFQVTENTVILFPVIFSILSLFFFLPCNYSRKNYLDKNTEHLYSLLWNNKKNTTTQQCAWQYLVQILLATNSSIYMKRSSS